MNMQLDEKNSVLAIYAHASGLGYAYLENPLKAIDCGVTPIKPPSHSRCFEYVRLMIEYHYPQTVVLQKIDTNQQNRNRVKKLLSEIEQYAVSRHINVYYYSREYLRFVYKEFKAKNKHEMAVQIGKYFPQFKNFVPEPRKPWLSEDYHMPLFDALGLAIAHYHKTT